MIIQQKVVWISTEEAREWLRFENPDVEIRMTRVDGMGVMMEVTPKHRWSGASPSLLTHQIGLAPADLVGLGRYLLAVAAAQGQDITRAPEARP
jgi:hypothetical protein